MRAFIVACLAVIVIGTGGYFGVNAVQRSSGTAYTTDSARINPKWTWRAIFPTGQPNTATKTTSGAPGELVEDCNTRAPWQWIFVDFGRPEGEAALCSVSQ